MAKIISKNLVKFSPEEVKAMDLRALELGATTESYRREEARKIARPDIEPFALVLSSVDAPKLGITDAHTQ